MEEALTGAPLTQEQQQRAEEVHENLEVPGIQNPNWGCEGQQVLVVNFSTSHSGVSTMSPKCASWTDTIPSSSNIFDLAVDRYGFEYRVIDEDNSDEVDVDVSEIYDNTNIENDDEANAENVPPVAQIPNRERGKHPHPVQTRRSQSAFPRT